IIVKQVGHTFLTVSLPSVETEECLISLPRLRIDGCASRDELYPKFYQLSIHDRMQRQRLLLWQITRLQSNPHPSLTFTSLPPKELA
ncbi:hypothetical protein EDB19DRAFT_1765311, partial [Suillus lakei]